MRKCDAARNFLTVMFLGSQLFWSGCGTYYLQKATVITNRKTPTVITSTESKHLFEFAVTGGYSRRGAAEYTMGTYLDSDPSATASVRDPEPEDESMEESSKPRVTLPEHNTLLHASRWNANMRFAATPLVKTTEKHIYKLRIVTEAQIGFVADDYYTNFKIGPSFSSIGEDAAVHPRILFGRSRVNAEYEVLRRSYKETLWYDSSSYSDSRSSGDFDDYRWFVEFGGTFELRPAKKFSLFCDVAGTLQYLFDYGSADFAYLRYAEFSPGIKIGLSDFTVLNFGISIPFNPNMDNQLSKQVFMNLQTSFGPSWDR